jgi:hypothetical protein
LPRAAAGGTANAITATFSPAITLADKTIVAVVAGAANSTTTPTFAPNGLTAHTITKNGNSALVAGDIAAAGHVILLEYNLAGTRWELLNPAVSGGGSSSLTATYIGYGDGSNALTGSAELTYNATNKAFGLSASRNNDVDIGVVNTNSGTGASAVVFAQNDGGSNVAFYKLGSNYTTSGLLAANEGFVYNNTAALLFTNSASADFIWSYGGTAATNEVARLGAGTFSLGVAGTTVGKVQLNNATSGSVTIQPTTGALGSATLTLPAGSSTPVIADTGSSNNFLTAISAGGVISKAQPAFSNLSGSATCAQLPALTGGVTSSAGSCATTVATNANLTGPITSSGNATSIASQTGTGTKFVVDTSPTIVTPTIAKLANLTTNGFVKTGSGDGTLSVDTTSYGTLTVASPAYSASITQSITGYSQINVGTLTGNLTLTLSGGVDGQPVRIRFKQDGTGSRLLTLDSKFRLGADITSVTLSTAINKTDYLGVIYNSADDKYDVVAIVKGY